MQESMINYIFSNGEYTSDNVACGIEYRKRSDAAFKIYNKMEEVLSEEHKKMLDNYIDEQTAAQAQAELINFREGFKKGMLLAMECVF